MRSGAAILGFLTGLSLCPPFLVAGVRAAQLPSLPLAAIFFVLFFVGTAIWFAPFLAVAFLRRNPQITLVARIAALFLAAYYALLGVTALLTRISHG